MFKYLWWKQGTDSDEKSVARKDIKFYAEKWLAAFLYKKLQLNRIKLLKQDPPKC